MLAGQGGAAAPGQEPEAVIQPVCDLLYGHHAQAGRGQFEGEGDSVQTAHNFGKPGGILGGKVKLRVHGPGPGQEELHRFGGVNFFKGHIVLYRGQRQ